MKKILIRSCNDHLDMAFDDFIYDNETFPILQECKDGNCDYCLKKNDYTLYLTLEEEN